MDLMTVLRQGITFGPFKTGYHRNAVNAVFQEAFLRHLAREIVPNLSIPTDSVRGSVTALYDDPKYLGPNSAVKFKYHFEGNFLHGELKENVRLEFAVDPGAGLRFEEPRVISLRDFERMRDHEEEARLALQREATADFVPVPTIPADRQARTGRVDPDPS